MDQDTETTHKSFNIFKIYFYYYILNMIPNYTHARAHTRTRIFTIY